MVSKAYDMWISAGLNINNPSLYKLLNFINGIFVIQTKLLRDATKPNSIEVRRLTEKGENQLFDPFDFVQIWPHRFFLEI